MDHSTRRAPRDHAKWLLGLGFHGFFELRNLFFRPLPYNERLACRGHQRAIFRPQMRRAMAEAVLNAMNADIAQHPLRRIDAIDADGIVEAVALPFLCTRPSRRKSAGAQRHGFGVVRRSPTPPILLQIVNAREPWHFDAFVRP